MLDFEDKNNIISSKKKKNGWSSFDFSIVAVYADEDFSGEGTMKCYGDMSISMKVLYFILQWRGCHEVLWWFVDFHKGTLIYTSM